MRSSASSGLAVPPVFVTLGLAHDQHLSIIKIHVLDAQAQALHELGKMGVRSSRSKKNIRAAVPQITLPTQEQFVPQMINDEVIGGVSFKKGCYPGQEIVARSQYLGKLKRRMMLASVESRDARAGIEVFSPADPEQPCGMIVNAERRSPNEADCLVEIKLAVMEAGPIHLGSANGPMLRFEPMPYVLFDPT